MAPPLLTLTLGLHGGARAELSRLFAPFLARFGYAAD